MVPSGQTGLGHFPDAVSEMDVHIGEFLDAIEDICIPNNGPEATDRTSKLVERRAGFDKSLMAFPPIHSGPPDPYTPPSLGQVAPTAVGRALQ